MNQIKGKWMFVAVCLTILASLVAAAQGFVKASYFTAAPKNLKFETVVSGLTSPVFVTHAGDGSGRLFIVQRNGKILIFKGGALNNTPFLDVGSIISVSGGEQGLLGLAFDPDYETNGRFFVVYTIEENNAVRLARYNVSGADEDIADPAGTVLLTIEKQYTNHNGGMIAFGPDGYLYMSVGDGGSGGDPGNNAQNKNSLLGKLLRLDVSGAGYTISPDNPFIGGSNVREEIWAYGLRNPWRFSFDRLTGDLYIGDVGQGKQEEIDYQSAASAGGENYGWRIFEGNLCYNASTCTPPPNYTAPVAVYEHGVNKENGCSVTGGYVYRGSQFPVLEGVYLYGDFCKGKIWGMTKSGTGQWASALIADTDFLVSSFGEDEEGELYLTDYASGRIYRIVEAPIVKRTFISKALHDGFLRESAETSGTGGAANASASILRVGDNSENRQYRSILSFRTAVLPDNAVILSATLRLKYAGKMGTLPFGTHGKLLVDIRKGAFNQNAQLERLDFSAAASKNNGFRYTNKTTNGWYVKKVGDAYLIYINKAGVTQFRLRFARGDNNDFDADFLKLYSGNAGSTNRPRLIVEYFIP